MVSKKLGLILSGGASIVLLLWDLIGNYQLCDAISSSGSAGKCPATLSSVETILLPVIPLFLVYIVVAFARIEVYESWFRFARWWIPLSMILIFISPEYPQGIYDPVQKGSVALVMSALFALISIAIIIWKYFATRSK